MHKLDRTGCRIVGVMLEKELTVPDTYPLSENALVDGCNQKNNRDPLMELVTFQVAGALMALQEQGWVARVEGGGRVPKFKHRLPDVLQVSAREIPVLAELLLRGPQAPGALKPRVARMGLAASPEEIEAILRELAARKPALVELLPLAPRERDRRWRHLLGDGSDAAIAAAEPANEPRVARTTGPEAAAGPVPPTGQATLPAAVSPSLVDRVARLERQVAELQQALAALRTRSTGD